MRHVVVEGMNAYYARDPLALEKLLRRLDENNMDGRLDTRHLRAVVDEWVRATHEEISDVHGAAPDLLPHPVPGA